MHDRPLLHLLLWLRAVLLLLLVLLGMDNVWVLV